MPHVIRFNDFIRPLGHTNNDTRAPQASLNQALTAVATDEQGRVGQAAFVTASRAWLDEQLSDLRRQGLHHFISKSNQAAQVERVRHLKQLEHYLSMLSATDIDAKHSVNFVLQQRIRTIQTRMNLFLGLTGVGLPFLLTFGSTALSLALVQSGQLLTPVNLAFGGIASSSSAAIIGLLSAVLIAGVVVGIIYGFQQPKRERLAQLNRLEENTLTPEELNDAYLAACKNNDTAVLHYLEETYQKRITDKTITNAYLTALHDEHKEMLSHLTEKWPNQISTALLTRRPSVYAELARSGNISMMTYIEETFPSIVPFFLELNDGALFSIALRECSPEVITHVDHLINEYCADPDSFKSSSLGRPYYELYKTALSRENPNVPEDILREYTKLVIEDYKKEIVDKGYQYNFPNINKCLITEYYLPAIFKNNERILKHIEVCYGKEGLLDTIAAIHGRYPSLLLLKRCITEFGEVPVETQTRHFQFNPKSTHPSEYALKINEGHDIHLFKHYLPITPTILSQLETALKREKSWDINDFLRDVVENSSLPFSDLSNPESIQILKRLIKESKPDTVVLKITQILHLAVNETDELVTTFHEHFPDQFNNLFLSDGYDLFSKKKISGPIKPIPTHGFGDEKDRPIVRLYKTAIIVENIPLMTFIEQKVAEAGYTKHALRRYADATSYAQKHKASKALRHILHTSLTSLDSKIKLYSCAIHANDKDIKDQLERDNLFRDINTWENSRSDTCHSDRLIQAAIIADNLDAFRDLMNKLDNADQAAISMSTMKCLISSGASRVLQHYMKSGLFDRACRNYAFSREIQNEVTNSLSRGSNPLQENPDASISC